MRKDLPSDVGMQVYSQIFRQIGVDSGKEGKEPVRCISDGQQNLKGVRAEVVSIPIERGLLM